MKQHEEVMFYILCSLGNNSDQYFLHSLPEPLPSLEGWEWTCSWATRSSPLSCETIIFDLNKDICHLLNVQGPKDHMFVKLDLKRFCFFMLNKVSSPRSPKKLCKLTIYLQSNQSLCPCVNSIILTTFICDNSFVQEHKLGIDISIQAEQKSILRYKLVKRTFFGRVSACLVSPVLFNVQCACNTYLILDSLW